MIMTVTRTHPWLPISQEQINLFDRDGFLILPEVLSSEDVEEMVRVGDDLLKSSDPNNRRDVSGCDGYRNVIERHPLFLNYLCHPSTFPLVVQMLGPHIQLHTSDLIYKDSESHPVTKELKGNAWHRDIGRLTRNIPHDVMPRVEIKVAFMMSDCPDNTYGQTRLARGSHLWRKGWSPTKDQLDPPETVVPTLKAGDVFMFENRTWHSPGPNISGHTRKILMMGYSYNWLRPDDYLHQSPELLESCDPIQQSLLEIPNLNANDEGRFRANSRTTPLEEWANEHGCQSPLLKS